MYCVRDRIFRGSLLLVVLATVPSHAGEPSWAPTVTAFVEAGGVYTTNRNLAAFDTEQEHSFSPEYGLRASGTLRKDAIGTLSYTVIASINSSRAGRFPEDSGETANFKVSTKYQTAQWTYVIAYNPTMDYTQWFDDYTGTAHVISGAASTTLKLDNGVSLTPTVGTSRREHVNEFAQRTRGAFSAAFEKTLVPNKVAVNFTPSASYDFYDISPAANDRRDITIGAALGFEFIVTEKMTWGLTVAGQRRFSSVDGLDYKVLNVLPSISAEYKF